MNEGLLFALVAAVVALLYGIVSIKWILGLPTGNDRMREIAAAVQEGASAYLNRQYTTIGVVGVICWLRFSSPWAGKPPSVSCSAPCFPASPAISA
jgi:Na+/H+-translocating membrane pyrophosphatase